MSISLAKIEKLLEPTKDRAKSVSWFIGTVLGINDSQLVVEMKSGNAVYVQNFAYCNVGDEVLCMSNGTSIVAISTRNAQSIADGLNKVGLVYNAGEGITIDDDNRINADVTQSDITQLSTEIAGKANTTHTHSAADTTSGVFDLERIPTIPASKLSGTIPNDMLPSYVDDVLEYASRSAFPSTGEDGKIYVDESTNKTYRWGGSSYVEISASLALGETENTAYRGDRGKQAYDHISRSDNPHGVTYQQVGAAAADHTHTPSDIGAAAATHNHSASNITSGYLPISRGGLGGGTATASLFNLIANSVQEFTGTDISNIYVALVDGDGSSTDPILKAVTPANFATGVATLIKPSDIGAAAETDLANYLPLTGGTLTGTVNTRMLNVGSYNDNTERTFSVRRGFNLDSDEPTQVQAMVNVGSDQALFSFRGSDNSSKNYLQLLEDKTRLKNALALDSGGTGANTAKAAQHNLLSNMNSASDTPTDSSKLVFAYDASTANNGAIFKRPLSSLWTWIKGKADSIYAAVNHTHAMSDVTGLQTELNSKAETLSDLGITATASEINKLDGITATTAELNYVDGVTSNIQTQLNGKAATNHAHMLNGSSVASPSWFAPRTAGNAGQYLVSSGSGEPVWTDIEGGVVFMPNGYPEGSVYLTYDPDFNPASEFGGTWTKETSTYLFLGITIWRCVSTPNQYFSPLDMHPVGTAFMTYDKAHNPAAEFGGTWTLETSTYMFLGIKIYRRVE